MICQGGVGYGLSRLRACLKKWQDIVHTQQKAADRADIRCKCSGDCVNSKEQRQKGWHAVFSCLSLCALGPRKRPNPFNL